MPVPISPEVTQGPKFARIDAVLERLPGAVYEPLGDLTAEAWVTPEPVPYAERRSGDHRVVRAGEVWGRLWDCAWFHFTGTVPAEAAGRTVTLLIDLGGEGCVVDHDGNPVQGLTNVRSTFDYSLGRPGKRVVPLLAPAAGGEAIDLWVEAGCNDLFGSLPGGGALQEARIAIRRDEVQALCFDFEVLRSLLDQLPQGTARHARVLHALYKAALLFGSGRDDVDDETVAAARALLAPELARRAGDPALTVSAVGHAHIDLAWLWPLRETIRKGARTFSTVLRMMERYPDYVFGASQPQLYQWMKERYPDLYRRICRQVADGRWEVQGAMWVEPDANLPSGESLVRQILYGKRFFRREFGIDVTNLWMPDVFGYSGSLPQILSKAGIRYFLTQKLSWSAVNHHPHHTFHWEGIDGSRILVHMPPEATYNSSASPAAIARAEKNYLNKDVSDRCLVLFGIGDGGGGPGEEHLERLAREKSLAGLAPVVQEPASRFFERLDEHAEEYAVWRGELYLEKHQGTLTTQARNKRYNREMEIALRELEFSAAQALRISGRPYPAAELDRIWQEVLLLQFHDILPGSSITRVYDESLARYAAMLQEVEALTADADAAWVGADLDGRSENGVAVVNSLSWDREEWLKRDGRWMRAAAPALGYGHSATASAPPLHAVTASPRRLENEQLRLDFTAEGDLVSVLDKENARELLRPGRIGNALAVYADAGDAWDMPQDYRARRPDPVLLSSAEAYMDGPCAILRQTRRFGASTLVQEIVLTAGSRRIDFRTHVDWRESDRMLRTAFPVAVHADGARCEIQFGNIVRPTTQNTTWDAAKYEVCGHRWIDISEADYGVALLNDSKYGHCVHDGVLDLNLLRSPSYPDPTADRAEHEFTYSLFPHTGDCARGGVVRAAYELNMPLRPAPAAAPRRPSPAAAASFLTVDAPNLIVETVKRAEDSDALIVRLYEAHGASAQATLRFGFPVKSVAAVDLMEENASPLALRGEAVTLAVTPFEIVTLLVVPR